MALIIDEANSRVQLLELLEFILRGGSDDGSDACGKA
jgi:hypothetical protein